MRKNIDRGFYHLGRGGAGQSLTTSHINALLAGLHAYLDMNIYFTDDEMRKQGELLVDMLVGTGQETVQGSANSLRFDLLKKHLSGDPIAMRLLYSIITKMVALIGWKRFECNILPLFSGVTEANFNSVMRRSWVMQMLATFVDRATLATIPDAEQKGIFLKDPTAKDTHSLPYGNLYTSTTHINKPAQIQHKATKYKMKGFRRRRACHRCWVEDRARLDGQVLGAGLL
jgi:hypothetical protein